MASALVAFAARGQKRSEQPAEEPRPSPGYTDNGTTSHAEYAAGTEAQKMADDPSRYFFNEPRTARDKVRSPDPTAVRVLLRVLRGLRVKSSSSRRLRRARQSMSVRRALSGSSRGREQSSHGSSGVRCSTRLSAWMLPKTATAYLARRTRRTRRSTRRRPSRGRLLPT